MHLLTRFDPEASTIAGSLTFFCDRYELSREDIERLKEKKLLRFVVWDGLPDTIPCQVIIRCESPRSARVILFNPSFTLPSECHEDPLLNRGLIEWSRSNGGFWIEFTTPLDDDAVRMDFSYEI